MSGLFSTLGKATIGFNQGFLRVFNNSLDETHYITGQFTQVVGSGSK